MSNASVLILSALICRYLRSEQLIVSYDAQIVGKKWQALSRTFSGGDIMNSENESIRANPGASPDRPIKKSGGGVLQDSINASPVRRRQAKQDSQLISEHLLHDSSPAPPADSLSQTKLPGGLQQPLLSPNDPEALLEEHLLDENAADSPGTPEQLDAAQLGSAFTSAWVDSASLQHEAHAGGAEQSIPGVHDSARSEQPSDVRQTANLARVEASPQPQVSLAVPSPHDTPDGALVAGVSTPDHPDDAAVRGSFASVIAGEDSFAEVSLLPNHIGATARLAILVIQILQRVCSIILLAPLWLAHLAVLTALTSTSLRRLLPCFVCCMQWRQACVLLLHFSIAALIIVARSI
jgi:hypothetical protein